MPHVGAELHRPRSQTANGLSAVDGLDALRAVARGGSGCVADDPDRRGRDQQQQPGSRVHDPVPRPATRRPSARRTPPCGPASVRARARRQRRWTAPDHVRTARGGGSARCATGYDGPGDATPDRRPRLPPHRGAARSCATRSAMLADERVAPRAAEIDRTAEFPRTSRRCSPSTTSSRSRSPSEHGGLGGGPADACASRSSRSAGRAPRPGLILAVQALGALPILRRGTPEQQDRWLPGLASRRAADRVRPDRGGRRLGCRRHPDPRRPRRRRVRHRRLASGSSATASVADYVMVFAVTNPDAPAHSAACRRSSSRTDRRASASPGSSTRWASAAARPPSSRSTASGSRPRTASARRATGFAIAMRTFERSRPGIAAQAVGHRPGRARGGDGVRHASARQFGQPIGEFQMVQAMLADMDAATEAARQLLYTACDGDRGRGARRRPLGGACVNSSPVTPRCGSRRTRSRSWADTATSTSTRSSG